MDADFIDEKVLSFEIFNGLREDGGVFKGDGAGGDGLVEDDLVDGFGEVEIELGLVLVIELCVHLLFYIDFY